MQGKIEVSSELGEGTCFTIITPTFIHDINKRNSLTDFD